MKILVSLSAMNEDGFEKALIEMGYKKDSEADHKDSGATKKYFSGPNGAKVFVMHNEENDFIRVSHTPGKGEDANFLQGSISDGDFEEFLKEIKESTPKAKAE